MDHGLFAAHRDHVEPTTEPHIAWGFQMIPRGACHPRVPMRFSTFCYFLLLSTGSPISTMRAPKKIHPLVNIQKAIENGPFIVDLPIKNGDFPIYSGFTHFIVDFPINMAIKNGDFQ